MQRPNGVVINSNTGVASIYNPATNTYDPAPEFNQFGSNQDPRVTFEESSGNNQGALENFFDFSNLPTPYVNFLESLGLAQSVGAGNRQTYFDNIGRARDSALGLVRTDVEGINYALDVLGPRYRNEGNQDTTTNIGRASSIDSFNIGRLPGINQANRKETQRANQFNSQQFQESIETSGINYRDRILGVIGRLEDRAEGRLPGALNEQLTRDLANRGSDLASASGIGATSGAGIRVGDRLTIQEKINLAVNADAQLPGVLGGAQGTLQSPYERAPTQYTSPTQVPLNVSNLADRIPVTSNISAGAAQQAIGTQATALEVIPATQILNSSLATQQFNAEAAFKSELIKGEKKQQEFDSVADFYQGLIDSDEIDADQAANLAFAQQGLDIREQQQQTGALGSGGGFFQNAAALYAGGAQILAAANGGSTGGQGGGSQGGSGSGQGGIVLQGTTGNINVPAPSGGGGASGGSSGGGGSFSGGGGYGSNATYYRGSGGTTPPTTTSYPGGGPVLNGPSASRYSGGIASPTTNPAAPDTINAISSGAPSVNTLARTVPRSLAPAGTYFNAQNTGLVAGQNGAPSSAELTAQIGARFGNFNLTPEDYDSMAMAANEFYKTGQVPKRTSREGSSGGDMRSPNTSETVGQGIQNAQQGISEAISPLTGAYNDITKPFNDIGIDDATLQQTVGSLSNWQNATPQDKFDTAGTLGVAVIENQGFVNAYEADNIRNVTGTFSTLTNPDATNEDKALAIAQLGTSTYVPHFTGNINAPNTINGQTVTGSTTGPNGEASFTLANGETFEQATLVNGVNTMSAVNAFSVLVSDADNDQKLASLTAIGIRPAQANGLIGQVAGGNLVAGLSLFNTATSWDQMNPIQQAASTIQTSSVVTSAIADSLISQGSTSAGASFFASGAATGATATGATTTTAAGGTAAISSGGSTAASSSTSAAGSAAAGTGAQILSGAAAVGGIGLGIYQAANTISAINDLPSSSGQKQGAIGLSAAGASIGAGVGVAAVMAGYGAAIGTTMLPIIGTAIGAAIGVTAGLVIGSTGSGKNTGQTLRDGWRQALEASGVAYDKEGSHHVELADGTEYNIGKDGGHKLTNADGTERHTFDVDWSDPKAAETVPDAHLLAIATGLDPTDSAGHGLFNRATAQGLNAAMSNAKDADGVRANLKHMMKDMDPRQVGMRVEILRQTNKIDEDEYNTYIGAINRTFGAQLTATDKEEGRQFLLQKLEAAPEKGNYEKTLLKELTDPAEIEKVIAQRDKRQYKDKKNIDPNSAVMPDSMQEEYDIQRMRSNDRARNRN